MHYPKILLLGKTDSKFNSSVVFFLKDTTSEVKINYSPFESSTYSFNSLNNQFKRQIEQPKEEEFKEEPIESNETDQEQHTVQQR